MEPASQVGNAAGLVTFGTGSDAYVPGVPHIDVNNRGNNINVVAIHPASVLPSTTVTGQVACAKHTISFRPRPPKIVDGRRVGQKPINAEFDRKKRFPHKLWAAVDDPNSIFHWAENGSTFLVSEREFEENVMKACPNLVQVPSFSNFRRQLREYGFQWRITNLYEFQFHHPLFSRNNHGALEHMRTRRRLSISGKRRKVTRALSEFPVSLAMTRTTEATKPISAAVNTVTDVSSMSNTQIPQLQLENTQALSDTHECSDVELSPVASQSNAPPAIQAGKHSQPIQWDSVASLCTVGGGDSFSQSSLSKQFGHHQQQQLLREINEQQVGEIQQQDDVPNQQHQLYPQQQQQQPQQQQQHQGHSQQFEDDHREPVFCEYPESLLPKSDPIVFQSMNIGSTLVMQPLMQNHFQQQLQQQVLLEQLQEKQQYQHYMQQQQHIQQHMTMQHAQQQQHPQQQVPQQPDNQKTDTHQQQLQLTTQQHGLHETQQQYQEQQISLEVQLSSNPQLQQLLHAYGSVPRPYGMAMQCNTQSGQFGPAMQFYSGNLPVQIPPAKSPLPGSGRWSTTPGCLRPSSSFPLLGIPLPLSTHGSSVAGMCGLTSDSGTVVPVTMHLTMQQDLE